MSFSRKRNENFEIFKTLISWLKIEISKLDNIFNVYELEIRVIAVLFLTKKMIYT